MDYFREDGTPAVKPVKPLDNSPGIFVDANAVRVYTKAQAAVLVKAANLKVKALEAVVVAPVKEKPKVKPKPKPYSIFKKSAKKK